MPSSGLTLPPLAANCGKRAGSVSPREDESLRTSSTVLQQQAPPAALVSKNVGSGPENLLAAASEAFELGGGAGGGGVGAVVSGAGLEISSGGEGGEVERCEGCGRTFAPGRLQSHAKVNRPAVFSYFWYNMLRRYFISWGFCS